MIASCRPRLSAFPGTILLVLFLACSYTVHANDLCTVSAGVTTCQGNQSSGVQFAHGVSQLDVLNLSADISPIAGKPGVKSVGNGSNGILGCGLADPSGQPCGTTNHPGGNGGSGTNMSIQFIGDLWKILTKGSAADGIELSSSGGDGGGGASIQCFSNPFGGLPSCAGQVNNGGNGGSGGQVSVSTAGGIKTIGDQADGVFAVSTGGNGGAGGDGLSTGANGGEAGTGGRVAVNSSSTITTLGATSYGIYASSRGGLGGDGGFANGLIFGKGGAGKNAGNGGEANVSNSGLITTSGANSRGIFAQSVGGFNQTTGGGSGGGAIGLWAIGGGGGSGGGGGTVTVTNSGQIETSGDGATGVLAESIGGGGGSGGSSVAIAPFVSVAWGGKGGAGGNGGAVTVVGTNSVVDTAGESAAGIQASSIGGGGGNGGFAASFGAGAVVDLTFAMGGSGNNGGDAGTVTVGGSNAITTQGSHAPGISAESLGGGGGSGGASASVGVAAGIPDTAPLAVTIDASVGGSGAGGGSGGTVAVGTELYPIMGSISTLGDLSPGIHAQSTGGGGGSGAFSVAGGASVATYSANISVGQGGSGAGGGTGGLVKVFSLANISTAGNSADAISAQSTGGGGGDGGFALTPGIALSTSFSATVTVALGGKGGNGGAAGPVEVGSAGVLTSSGELSDGISAISTGGGGGKGGSSLTVPVNGGGKVDVNIQFSAGGNGGSGGLGGDVTVGPPDTPVSGAILTYGNTANGIFAQSVGGGGGDGGSSANLQFNSALQKVKSYTKVNLEGALGGTGGVGNLGGNVDVNNDSEIDTFGSFSNGIYAQSVGGGGGKGGRADAINLSTSSLPLKLLDIDTKDFGVNVTVGGSGGSGNNGGAVSVVNRGSISTEGTHSYGIFAQSIGGGGGGSADGVLGKVGDWLDAGGKVLDGIELVKSIAETLTTVKEAKTDGAGKLLGLVPTNISVNVGGSGGADGDGSTVSVNNNAAITTTGTDSSAIYAQSIGGGGGEAANYVLGEGSNNGQDASVGIGLIGNFAIGGAGGAAGNGGAVTVWNRGAIVTRGVGSDGLYAQSVGGGGGQAGSVSGGFADLGNLGIDPAFGQGGGNGGNGGVITITNSSDISTYGKSGIGIYAQSIGGGGGVLGDVGGIARSGSVGGYGSGGQINLTQTGNIVAYGDAADGIFAQSQGGVSGLRACVTHPILCFLFPRNYAAYEGHGGDIAVTLTGNVITQGKDSIGVRAQSFGQAGNGDIVVNINEGTVSGGSGSGAGVEFVDGAANQLFNHGTVTALSGMAVKGGNGAETIDNYGIISGSVELGAGSNSFQNERAGTLESGPTLYVGAGNVLTNGGTLSPGGVGTVLTTALTGDLSQSDSGTYVVSLNSQSNEADAINVSGRSSLTGQVSVDNINPGFARPGDHKVIILTSGSGVTGSDLNLLAPTSAVLQYHLLYPDPTHLALSYGVHFSPPDLNPNQSAIGNYISTIQAVGGSSSLAPVVATIVGQPDAHSLADAYDHLSPESYLGRATGALFSNIGFSDSMHSCGVPGGSDRFVREGECDWFQLMGGELNQEQTPDNMGSNRWSLNLSTGQQRAVGDGSWHAGWGFAYDYSILHTDQLANTSGDQFQVGAILKKEYGETSLAADLSAGYGNYNSDRFVNLPGPNVTAQSNQDVKFVSAHVRLAHAFEQGSDWYVKPIIDLGATHSWFPAFQETGAGAADLNVEGRTETYVALTPELEVGGETRLANGLLLRPYARLGVTHFFSGASPVITATFQGAPVGVAPFTVTGEMDKTYEDIQVGLVVLRKKGQLLKLGYTGTFSDHLKSNTGSVKLTIPF